MTQRVRFLLACAFCVTGIAPHAAPPAGHRDESIVPSGKPIALFNGRDFAGLYTFLQDTKRADPRGVFTVRDGLLRISGDGFGYLSTERSYRDYRLVVEFKWGRQNFRGR